MTNLLSYCGLVDVKINASDKDLPVYYSTDHEWVESFYPNLVTQWKSTNILRRQQSSSEAKDDVKLRGHALLHEKKIILFGINYNKSVVVQTKIQQTKIAVTKI